MNMKAVIPLGLAVVLGLVAAMLVRSAIARRSQPVAAASNLVTVVTAKDDVQPGKALTILDVSTVKLPAEAAPGHVFSDPNQLVGRVVTTPLVKGQTILDTLLADTGTGDGLQALIPPGMRAVTTEVNEFSGVGGMLQPGCRVDLISVLRDDKSHTSMARTILENIKVTAIGRSTAPAKPVDGQPLPPPANSITLLCTPKQAQTLELASQSSRPWLVLRSPRDGIEAHTDPTSLAELTGGDSAPGDIDPNAAPVITTLLPTTNPSGGLLDNSVNSQVESQPTSYRRTVTIIRGGVESQQTFVIPVPRSTSTSVDIDNDRDPLLPNNR
jgi:pilus assembly protein CpaB